MTTQTTQNITTSNLADFGTRELEILIDLLQAWRDQGLPEDFNDDHQVAMLNGEKLSSFYSCPNCGHEGFEKTCKINDEGCNVCIKN